MVNEIKFPSQFARIRALGDRDAFLVSRPDGSYGYMLLSEAKEFKGDQGAPFTYDDFTPAQLAALEGKAGDPFTYDDLTDAQIAELQRPATEAVLTISERIDLGLAALVGTAPDALNTLQELAAAIGDDPAFVTTMLAQIAKRVMFDDPRLEDARNVINQAGGGAVRIWTGTQAQYDALTKESDTLYFIL